VSYGAAGILGLVGVAGAIFAKKKCRDVDGGEDGTIDQDILEDDYRNEDARVADTEDVEDVEMSYTKYEETTKDVNYALSQSPLD
jgi:predicted transglutaminase-like protease